jgi:hypothetical protein
MEEIGQGTSDSACREIPTVKKEFRMSVISVL